jgi:hypothetical protein
MVVARQISKKHTVTDTQTTVNTRRIGRANRGIGRGTGTNGRITTAGNWARGVVG